MGESIEAALVALEELRDSLQWIRASAAAQQPAPNPQPVASGLAKVFEALECGDESPVAPVRRWALYAIVRVGFASSELAARLLPVRNSRDEEVGVLVHQFMSQQFERYRADPEMMASFQPYLAVEWLTRWIRQLLRGAEILTCDPENLELSACRGAHPSDTDYITTVKVAGDFPRTVSQLTTVYDPRKWVENPYTHHFEIVRLATDLSGSTEDTRPHPTGYIFERVKGAGWFENTLDFAWAATPSFLYATYALGKAVASSSTLSIERDFGYILVQPVPGRPGWSRVTLEKNVRFTPIPGGGGGDIGWGDLPNLLAPALVADWLTDMCHAPCWIPS